MRGFITIVLSLCLIVLKAQYVVDFNAPTQVCLGEFFNLQNTSDSGGQAKWDFCTDQLDRTYSSTPLGTVVNNMTDLAMVEDNGQWYGFVTSRNNVLLRLDFGNSPYNTYTVTTVSDPNNLLISPEGISIVKEGNNWFGLITLIGSEIIRISWGTSLASMPQLQSLNLNSAGKLNAPIQIEIGYDQGNYTAVIANANGNYLTTINFGTSLGNNVDGSDMLVSPALPAALNLYGVAISNHCDQWELYAIAQNRIYKITLGTSLSSAITLGQVVDFSSSIPISIGSFNKIEAIDIGDNAYVYFTSFSEQYIVAIKWQEGSTSPQFLTLGNPSVPTNPYSFDILHYQEKYGLYVAGFGGNLNRISTDGVCHSNVEFSMDVDPAGVSYDQAGTYTINLEMTYGNGLVCRQSKQVIVTSSLAPLPVINSDNMCVSSTISLGAASQNGISITGWNWDFGTGTSALANPTLVFNTAGNYAINLEVTSANGCSNTASKLLKIYDKPIAMFSIPSGLVCTNSEFPITSTTPDNYDGNLSYQWDVNNIAASMSRDLIYKFTTAGNADIKLKTSIPGCESSLTQNIPTIVAGPSVNFSFAGICQSTPTQFTNQTIGSVQSYAWTFSDGNTSSSQNPQNTYATIGDYSVTLTATNAAGCNNIATKTVVIKSKPQPNFVLDLPPFSCSGSISQFNDITPNPTDSNISSWVWGFGDAQNGTSTAQNAKYTYTNAGQYNVSLTATTNFGCSAFVQKQITIQQSPQAAFTNSMACVNQAANFVDTSAGSIKSRLWTIGSNTYSTPTVSNTFAASGNFQAQLMVTATNNCVATASKTIAVPVPPSLDFSIQNNCSGQNAIFTDVTPVGPDPVSTRVWDFANQGTGTGSPTQHLFSSTGTYGVKMTVTNQSGCSYPITKNIVITKTPSANFTTSTQSGPPPLVVQFNNTSTNATSYLWQFSDTAGSTSNQLSPSFTFTSLGDYLVKLTATSLQGCKDTFSKEINVIVPLPDLAVDKVNVIRNATTGTIKMSISIRNKGNSIISGASLLVDASGGLILKENVSNVIQPGETLIYVTTTELVLRTNEIKYLCAEVGTNDDKDLSNNKECLLVEDELVYFPAYPNPSHGLLHLDWIAALGDDANVLFVNSLGQKVYSKQIGATREGLNQLEFDVSNLNAGDYILVFQIDGKKKSFRFSVI